MSRHLIITPILCCRCRANNDPEPRQNRKAANAGAAIVAAAAELRAGKDTIMDVSKNVHLTMTSETFNTGQEDWKGVHVYSNN
jgi:hypothetical protein